jgi:anti-sigma factor RsiW
VSSEYGCDQAREAIHRRLDADLMEATDLDRLQAHLVACESCRELEQELKTIQSGLRGLPTMKLPDEVLERVFQETERAPSHPKRPMWALIAAASLVVALGGWWAVEQRPSGPTDAELVRASQEARLVLKMASDALKRTERTAFHDVVAGELGGALRRAPVEWPGTSGGQRRGS